MECDKYDGEEFVTLFWMVSIVCNISWYYLNDSGPSLARLRQSDTPVLLVADPLADSPSCSCSAGTDAIHRCACARPRMPSRRRAGTSGTYRHEVVGHTTRTVTWCPSCQSQRSARRVTNDYDCARILKGAWTLLKPEGPVFCTKV